VTARRCAPAPGVGREHWQEIGSAPVDGTWILGWVVEDVAGMRGTLSFAITLYNDGEFGDGVWVDLFGNPHNPTHWQSAMVGPAAEAL
jgi:hypothetical protein